MWPGARPPSKPAWALWNCPDQAHCHPVSALTDEIAQAAARLVVDEGLDYPGAKRRAAADLARHGVGRAELPSNELVEDAVREHLALFHADTQPQELRALRRHALTWLERLAEFRPHLGGAVWRGTATRLSPIVIDLYADDPKAPEISLLNRGIDYDSAGDEDAQVLSLADRCPGLALPGPRPDDWITLHLVVHDHDALRGALKPDSRGQSWRGDARALRARLEEPA